MSTKIRNKSAHNTGINVATGENLVNNITNNGHHQQQQSLLKIESVVPKLTSRTLKLQKPHLTKSHSTLTSAYIKKVNESKRTFLVSGNGGNVVKQLETGGHCAGNDASIFINNGIYTIKRNQKEKDKLPDRINLDRKGLTMIPAIEEEPNLRLLSLQHNLINVFYISGDIPTTTKKPDQVSTGPSPPKEFNVPLNNNVTTTNQFVTNPPRNAILHRQLSRQRSITTRNQLILNNNNISYMGNKASNGSSTGNSTGNNSNNNSTAGNSTFLQKSLLLNAQPKHILKKSNSFINNSSNYPSFLTAAPTTSFMTQQQQQKSQIRNKLMHTPSFSVDNLSTVGSTSNGFSGNQQNGVVTEDTPALPGTTSNTPDLIKMGNGLLSDSPPPAIEVKHNLINLVFLDLYDNQIEVIGNLEGLKSLTVLLLGKNRITDISGLVCVKNTLRVLDLHGNKISNISAKISALQELKSLNLAGNLLKQVQDKDFAGLYCLKELNLKRNKIKKICGFEDLRNLERLWLCHNELQRVEDMSSIARALNLKEVTIENNPVSLAGDCVSFLVSYLPNLISLSQMQITEQVRRAAAAWRKNKEASDANYLHLTSDVCHSMRREEIISNARTNWELLRSQQSINTTLRHPHPPQKPISCAKMPVRDNDHLEHESGGPKRYTRTSLAPNNRFKKITRKPLKPISRDNSTTSEQGGEDYFRLPPILSPFLDHNKDSPNSNSSLGPNVDSGSSVYSSDNDGEKEGDKVNKPKQDPLEQTVIVKVTEDSVSDPVVSKSSNNPPVLNGIDQLTSSSTSSTKPEPATSKEDSKPEILLPIPIAMHEITLPIPGPEELNPVDKQSNVSTTSAKSNESLVTNMSGHKNNETSNNSNNNHSEQKAERCKSSMPKRQNTISSISSSRAQTARNTNNANNSNANGNSSNANNSSNTQKTQNKAERDREQGGDYLIEICGRYLNVYGYGALKFIDKQWNVQKATDVHTIKFSYINYNNITAALGKIKIRFPNAEHFVFRETNMYCLGQLNALAETQGLASLTIDCEGNTIMSKNWRSYAIYRLSHWGLKVINNDEITEEEIQASEALYSGLSDLVLWSLPEALLQPLLTRLRLEETCQASKMTAKEWLMQAEASLKSVVGKEALQWKKNGQFHEEAATREKGKKHFTFMMENTCNAVEKLQRLDTMWPSVLHEMIRNTLIDYSQIDAYVKNLMQEVLK